MYDELLERIHKRIALTTAGSPLQDDLKKAADAIEELSKESARWQAEAKDWYLAYMDLLPTRWISVEERLPEERQDVLVALRRGEIAVDYYQPNRWGYSDVTHWMPLPQAPKEE